MRSISLLLLMGLACCQPITNNLSDIGQKPPLSHIQNPHYVEGYQPVSMPMPDSSPPSKGHVMNSLWETGAKSFFKDQRAQRIGDIVTVSVQFDQKQHMEMTPTLQKINSSKTTLNNALGLEKLIPRILPTGATAALGAPAAVGVKTATNLMDVSSNPSMTASAKYDLQDKMNFKLACYVMQVLPNGSLVIQGRMEARLVNEVREVYLTGIVKREHINTDNTITSDKIAELRISYGGRGDLSEMQEVPWGQKIVNKISPF